MSQDQTLLLLRQMGHPVRPCELQKFAETVGAVDPHVENHGRMNRDLRGNLMKWGLVRQLSDGRCVCEHCHVGLIVGGGIRDEALEPR